MVVAEGEETEPEYFRGLAKFLRATGVDVQPVHAYGTGRDPLRIVNEAAGRAGLISRPRDTEEYDQVWCVVDVDEHETLEPACARARDLGISLAVTNPCFELWVLWHYQDHTRHARAAQLKAALKKHGMVDKHLPSNFKFSEYSSAVQRATRAGSCAVGTIPGNPGSSVCILVQALEAGGLVASS